MVPGKAYAYLALALMALPGIRSSAAPLYTHSAEDRIPGQYIVVLKDHVDVVTFTRSLEASVLRGTSEGKILTTYEHAIKGFSAQLSDNTVNKLRVSDQVAYIEEDGIVHASAISSWGLGRVDQRSRPVDSYNPNFLGDGAGSHLYIIDTGTLKTHSEFSGRMSSQGFDAIGNSIGEDCNGHGTHCGGTAAGTTYGIATKATVYSVRVLSCAGPGSIAGVIDGMNWVAQNGANKPSVASMSLSGSKSIALNNALQGMVNAGISVSVAAANNDIDACDVSPASAPAAITVGATNIDDKRASFSNHGSCVDLFAPGVGIKSSWKGSNSATHTISGTSMATPHVSGAIAVMLGLNGQLTAAQVTDQLLKASTPNKVSDSKSSPNKMLYVGRDTCMGRCNAANINGLGCQCDSGCAGREDCCSDKATVCGGQANKNYQYLGCFVDTSTRAIPDNRMDDHSGLTIESCVAHCRNVNKRYAGLQAGYACFCGVDGVSYDRYGNKPDSECNKPCPGNASQKCGAGWRNTVVDLWAPGECFTRRLGEDYRGHLSGTVSGKTCQRWTAQSPHEHSYTTSKYPQGGLGDHNYCRNPDSYGSGAWCYTTDPSKRWDLCNLGNPTASCGPPSKNYQYLGCYVDTSDRAIPDNRMDDHSGLSVESCVAHCRVINKRYAGIQAGYACFCGDNGVSYDKHGQAADSECNRQCPGNPPQKCGAGWRNSVFDLWASSARMAEPTMGIPEILRQEPTMGIPE